MTEEEFEVWLAKFMRGSMEEGELAVGLWLGHVLPPFPPESPVDKMVSRVGATAVTQDRRAGALPLERVFVPVGEV